MPKRNLGLARKKKEEPKPKKRKLTAATVGLRALDQRRRMVKGVVKSAAQTKKILTKTLPRNIERGVGAVGSAAGRASVRTKPAVLDSARIATQARKQRGAPVRPRKATEPRKKVSMPPKDPRRHRILSRYALEGKRGAPRRAKPKN